MRPPSFFWRAGGVSPLMAATSKRFSCCEARFETLSLSLLSDIGSLILNAKVRSLDRSLLDDRVAAGRLRISTLDHSLRRPGCRRRRFGSRPAEEVAGTHRVLR